METEPKRLQVLVRHGAEDREQVLFALHTALVGAVSGAEVTIFFALAGTAWACLVQNGAQHDGEVEEVWQRLAECGVAFECCSRCLDRHCAREPEDTRSALRDGVRAAGLARMLQRTLDGVPTLTF